MDTNMDMDNENVEYGCKLCMDKILSLLIKKKVICYTHVHGYRLRLDLILYFLIVFHDDKYIFEWFGQ